MQSAWPQCVRQNRRHKYVIGGKHRIAGWPLKKPPRVWRRPALTHCTDVWIIPALTRFAVCRGTTIDPLQYPPPLTQTSKCQAPSPPPHQNFQRGNRLCPMCHVWRPCTMHQSMLPTMAQADLNGATVAADGTARLCASATPK